MKKIVLIALTVLFLSCKEDVPVDPFQAEYLVEQISSNPKWQAEYSDANIVTETKFVPEYEGERTVVTLYPETADELVVIYNGDTPVELYWYKSGQWKTNYGTVGDPITVLEKANEAPISFYGLGYDLPGKVKIDEGKLAGKKVTFAVRPTSEIIPTEFYSYNSFALSTKEAQDLKLFITRVQIEIPAKAVEAN